MGFSLNSLRETNVSGNVRAQKFAKKNKITMCQGDKESSRCSLPWQLVAHSQRLPQRTGKEEMSASDKKARTSMETAKEKKKKETWNECVPKDAGKPAHKTCTGAGRQYAKACDKRGRLEESGKRIEGQAITLSDNTACTLQHSNTPVDGRFV